MMDYALPSGVINTDNAYFYADSTLSFGPLVKELSDQTLVILDYSHLDLPNVVNGYEFILDTTSNPALVVSYPHLTQQGNILTFLLSGGIVGQQYKLTIKTVLGVNARNDVLTVNIPSSSGDCVAINPVPQIYTQIALGDPTQGYVNTAVRFFWGRTPPINPNVMDQWYDPDTQMLSEWITNGTQFYWSPVGGAMVDPALVYLKLTGGTMTGMLTLVGNPVGNLDAVPKQYVDNAVVNTSIDCGTY